MISRGAKTRARNLLRDAYKAAYMEKLSESPRGYDLVLDVGGEIYNIPARHRVAEWYIVTRETIDRMGKQVRKIVKKELSPGSSEEELSFTSLVKEFYRKSKKGPSLQNLIGDLESYRSKIGELGNRRLFIVPKEVLANIFAEHFVRSEEGKKEVQKLLEDLVSSASPMADRSLYLA